MRFDDRLSAVASEINRLDRELEKLARGRTK